MSEQNLSPSEQYAIQLNNHEPSYYAQVPGIIYHCTYLVKCNGKTIRKKISSTAIALYGLIKQLGGQKEMSWASTETLAKYLGKSTGAISSAKSELTQPIEQLNGKPLIEIESRRKGHKTGNSPYHVLRNTHIWPENNAFMSTFKNQPKYPLGEIEDGQNESDNKNLSNQEPEDKIATLSNSERVALTRSIIETVIPGTRSIIETNKNQYQNQNHSDKESESEASFADCSSDCSFKSSVSDSDSDESKNSINTNDIIQRIDRWKTALRKVGADENFIREIEKNYSLEKIEKTCFIIKELILKKKKIDNICGYFRKILQGA